MCNNEIKIDPKDVIQEEQQKEILIEDGTKAVLGFTNTVGEVKPEDVLKNNQ